MAAGRRRAGHHRGRIDITGFVTCSSGGIDSFAARLAATKLTGSNALLRGGKDLAGGNALGFVANTKNALLCRSKDLAGSNALFASKVRNAVCSKLTGSNALFGNGSFLFGMVKSLFARFAS